MRDGERERERGRGLGWSKKGEMEKEGARKTLNECFHCTNAKGGGKRCGEKKVKATHTHRASEKRNRLIAVTSLIATFLSVNRTVTVKPKPSGLHDQDRIVGCCFFNSSHCAAVAHRDRQDYKQVLHGVFPCNAEPWRRFLAIIASLSTNLSYCSGNCATAAAFVPKWQIFCWHGRVSFT